MCSQGAILLLVQVKGAGFHELIPGTENYESNQKLCGQLHIPGTEKGEENLTALTLVRRYTGPKRYGFCNSLYFYFSLSTITEAKFQVRFSFRY